MGANRSGKRLGGFPWYARTRAYVLSRITVICAGGLRLGPGRRRRVAPSRERRFVPVARSARAEPPACGGVR